MKTGLHAFDSKQVDTSYYESPRTSKTSNAKGRPAAGLEHSPRIILCRECLEPHHHSHYETRNLVCQKCRGVVE